MSPLSAFTSTTCGLIIILTTVGTPPEDYSNDWWLLILGSALIGSVVSSFARRMDLAREARK